MTANGEDAAITTEDTERAINAPGPGFLGLLQTAHSNIRQYAYENREQFLDNVDESFLLTEVSNDIFQSTFLAPEEDDDDGPFSQWSAYDAELGLMLFKTPESPRHSFAGEAFDFLLIEALQPIDMSRQMIPIGTELCMSLTGGKKPDKAWRPRGPWCEGRTEWPNLVLEVAVSETRRKLESDIRWWVRKCPRRMNTVTVLAVAISRRAPTITIEKWQNDANGDAGLQQTIVISKNQTTSTTITITGAPLLLEFDKLFERQPATPTERDIEIGNDPLEWWAEVIRERPASIIR
ncbi:hypothetical protein BJX66DRAFT_348568 [Aspergillus keveii]|uniref:Restriction endonuclease domain-containing protein n=1 Tax=Aspergillus keveii TaxID=714993 RepID=A0ABR4GEF9_9EURO